MSFPERSPGFIEDGRFYEVPVLAEPVTEVQPITAIPVGVAAAAEPAVGPATSTRPPAGLRVLLAALIVLILAAAGGLTFLLLRPTGPNSTVQISACRAKVKANLKAPATAQFSQETVARQPTGNLYEVRGLVDAENGFGALLRQRYACTVTADGQALSASLSAWN